MIVTTNNLYNEATLQEINQIQGLVELLVTQDLSVASNYYNQNKEKNEDIKRHFILTTHPTTVNYKATLETLALATKLDNLCGTATRNESALYSN